MDTFDKVMLIICILLFIVLLGGCTAGVAHDEKQTCLTLSVAYPNLAFEYLSLSCNLVIDGVYTSISTNDVLILQKLNDK